ncbi:MAG: hypothetical protein ACRDZO_26935 [Egibacteraceae bacterium]
MLDISLEGFFWGAFIALVLSGVGWQGWARIGTGVLGLGLFPEWILLLAGGTADLIAETPETVATRSVALIIIAATILWFVIGRVNAERGRAHFDAQKAWNSRKDYRQ